ncbi:MAG: deoxyguanosinetriphosphate triphosphohydrolase [Spirochaetaceae bacterium]|nr:deoxyguanosinetriphosphate triphosphohydrolase [Spirochaetaceae bacterium]
MTGLSPAPDERWVDEPAKRSGRTAYERDRARVLHSSALRRLAGKTQVVVPGESDFPRTRLTHSLECAQIGRGIGKSLGCDPDLVETACLAHDIGHPPFGHTGEAALADVAREWGGFEGNAQSLRILTRLEAKAFSPDGRSVGLNLTRAALDASCKYPWGPDVDARKFGVYADDVEVFDWFRAGVSEGVRCLEAQVMDWADDVAYSVHDLEDAVFTGHLRLELLADADERSALAALAAARYQPGGGASTDQFAQALDRLVTLPFWPRSYDGSHGSLAALKNATSQLIGRFARAAEGATREAFGPAPRSRYEADLVVPADVRAECEILKAVADRYVMSSPEATARYVTQTELVRELVELMLRGAPATLEPLLRGAFEAAPDDAGRRRVVLDEVASLTDASAVITHSRLTRTGG